MRNRLFVEKLLASLASEVDSEADRVLLNEVSELCATVSLGQAALVDGAEGMEKVHSALRK